MHLRTNKSILITWYRGVLNYGKVCLLSINTYVDTTTSKIRTHLAIINLKISTMHVMVSLMREYSNSSWGDIIGHTCKEHFFSIWVYDCVKGGTSEYDPIDLIYFLYHYIELHIINNITSKWRQPIWISRIPDQINFLGYFLSPEWCDVFLILNHSVMLFVSKSASWNWQHDKYNCGWKLIAAVIRSHDTHF